MSASDRETETGVLTHTAATRVLEKATPGRFHDDLQGAAPLRLSHQITRAGEAVVDICGELDIATAEVAVRYVRHVIDRHHGPVIADLAALGFCDASGLGALVRMARYAEQAGRVVRAGLPSPVTGQDHADHRTESQVPDTPAAAYVTPESYGRVMPFPDPLVSL